jgi:hypothetical protein
LRTGLLIAIAVTLGSAPAPASAQVETEKPGQLTADLDGRPIEVADVGDWYCEDFSYPVIHCFSDPDELEARAVQMLATTAIVYVTVYDQPGFAGSYMHMSEDYTVLAWVGWNDRISSLKGKNSQNGHFYIDWFNGGAIWGFCCNQQFTSLGSYDNTFSAVHRN